MTLLQEIGEMLRGIRTERGMTQTEVADKSDLAQTRISEIESGKINISVDSFYRVARALGCDVKLVPSTKQQSKKRP